MTTILNPELVVRMLLSLPGVVEDANVYEIAPAISVAANASPVREEEEAWTAAMLVAIAWHESKLNRFAVGDGGRSFGLYQINVVWKFDKEVLFEPWKATPIATGILKRSYQTCIHRPWEERMSWYAASGKGCPTHPKIVAQSKERMLTARHVFSFVSEEMPWAH